MITNLMPYPTYKDSGVEWLGKVPEHWRPFALKQITRRVQNGTTPATSEQDYYADGTIAWYGPSSFGAEEEVGPPTRYLSELAFSRGGARLVRGPALLVVVIGTVGRMVLMRHDGSTNQQITAFELSPETVSPRFILRQLKFAETWLRSSASAATIPILDSAVLARIPCVLPLLDEQYAIARFLDHATSRIDRYIRAKERLIELLEEERQATIHEAVTGRIDVRTGQPYPAYKDSRVEWLAKVPAHWQRVSNKAMLSRRKVLVGTRHTEFELLSLTKAGVIVRDVSSGRGKFSADMGTSQRVRCGDLVFCLFDVPETPRTVGLSEHDGMITGAYTVFECNDPLLGRFLEAFYIAMDNRKLLSPLYSGLRNTIPPSKFFGVKTPVPPRHEKRFILNHLADSEAKIGAAIICAKKEVSLLNEYRTRLIADVVTGKLDVREAVAGLPDAHPVATGTEVMHSEANSHGTEYVVGKEAVP